MISEYLGFDSDYIILGLAGVVIILLILIIINMVQTGKLKKRYKVFMSGKTAKSLEDTIIKRLDEVDELVAANSSIKKNIEELFANMKCSYQKVGLVKYDAFNEMGGKLSFSLAMLNGRMMALYSMPFTVVRAVIHTSRRLLAEIPLLF